MRRRRWLSREQFLDYVGATNLIPGPNSTELAIHIGLARHGWPGLFVSGVCFILPSALIVGDDRVGLRAIRRASASRWHPCGDRTGRHRHRRLCAVATGSNRGEVIERGVGGTGTDAAVPATQRAGTAPANTSNFLLRDLNVSVPGPLVIEARTADGASARVRLTVERWQSRGSGRAGTERHPPARRWHGHRASDGCAARLARTAQREGQRSPGHGYARGDRARHDAVAQLGDH